jgi:hypothetical protein
MAILAQLLLFNTFNDPGLQSQLVSYVIQDTVFKHHLWEGYYFNHDQLSLLLFVGRCKENRIENITRSLIWEHTLLGRELRFPCLRSFGVAFSRMVSVCGAVLANYQINSHEIIGDVSRRWVYCNWIDPCILRRKITSLIEWAHLPVSKGTTVWFFRIIPNSLFPACCWVVFNILIRKSGVWCPP